MFVCVFHYIWVKKFSSPGQTWPADLAQQLQPGRGHCHYLWLTIQAFSSVLTETETTAEDFVIFLTRVHGVCSHFPVFTVQF